MKTSPNIESRIVLAFLALFALACDGCGSKSSAPVAAGPAQVGNASPQPSGKTPFLDEEKDIPAGLEWNREIVSRKGGPFSFRIVSQGPFNVILVAERSYKAIMSNNGQGAQKTDMILNAKSTEPQFERQVTLPAGSHYFIIENKAGKPVRMHLQCFDLTK